MIHAALALLAQAAIGLLTGNWWAGAAFAIGFYAGREHAQAEYRWIERYGLGVRANMPWHGGFQGRVWTAKSVIDVAAPTAAVVIIAYFL